MPDLTGLPALDLAIGLSFIFLLLSLLASAVQEVIAGVLALRAKTLELGLRNMLEGDDTVPAGAATITDVSTPARNLVNDLYGHPQIRALYKKSRWPVLRKKKATTVGAANTRQDKSISPWQKGRLPSYISPRSFARALMDTLAPNAQAPQNGVIPQSHDVIAAIRTQIADLNVPAGVKHRLLSLLDDARGDIDAFRQNIEAWFDDTMARVSGWYKRQAQLILCVIGVFVAIGLNANTLTMGDRLWKDTAVRDAVVQQATDSSVTGQTQGASAKERLNNAADNVDSVAKLGVPVGWSKNDSDPRHVSFASAKDSVRIIGGWLLTIVAIALGAPFWFDTLSRLSRLRNSGKPETPLPATGRGLPNERVVTQAAPVNVTVHATPSGP